MKLAEYRKAFRDSLGKGSYARKEYEEFVRIHARTLEKYLSNFNGFLRIELFDNRPFWFAINPWLFAVRTGINYWRVRSLMVDAYPSIREIVKIERAYRKRMRSQFLKYLLDKTHLSYGLGTEPFPLEIPGLEKKKKEDLKFGLSSDPFAGQREKFGEFVWIILAEYVILHNFMWSGKVKPGNVKTIDTFMRTLK